MQFALLSSRIDKEKMDKESDTPAKYHKSHVNMSFVFFFKFRSAPILYVAFAHSVFLFHFFLSFLSSFYKFPQWYSTFYTKNNNIISRFASYMLNQSVFFNYLKQAHTHTCTRIEKRRRFKFTNYMSLKRTGLVRQKSKINCILHDTLVWIFI